MLNTKEKLPTLTEITVAKDKMWRIEGDRRGDVINCLHGILWITQEGDLKDYAVEASRNFWVTKRGTVVVQALDDSQFRYSLNEMQNHFEINRQSNKPLSHSRINHFLR